MTERNERKVYVGKVVSDKMDKTIVVEVSLIKQHPKYRKRIKRSTRLTAHDENNIAKDGDTVQIMETRPLSKTKRFRLVEVLEESVLI
ncbi:MAG: 30S ribosomal protein S17 [Atopostipes suicloacalis]|nr:30S ribosomal protein S17 [Atopostipes suicloacalis]